MTEELKSIDTDGNGNCNRPIKKCKTQWLKSNLEASVTYECGPINYGERLYRKSLALDGLKSKELNKLKASTDKQHHCSFKPKINTDASISLSTAQSRMQRLTTLSSFNTTSNRLSTEQTKEQSDLEELRKYNSKKLSTDTIIRNSDRLYNEKDSLQRKKDQLTEMCFNTLYPFKPKVNDTSKPAVHNFFVRLQTWVDQKNSKIQEQNNSLPIDLVTHQVLFTPVINEGHPKRDKEVHDILLMRQEEKEKKLEDVKANKAQEIINKSNKQKISANSQKIVEKQKKKVFNALFDYIVTANSDVIRYSDDIGKKMRLYFSNTFMREFDPLLNELKELNETLNRAEFNAAMDKIYNNMALDGKREMMAFQPKQ